MLKRLAKVPLPTWILFGLAWLAALWIITTPFGILGTMRRPNLIDYASSLAFAALAAFALPHYASRLRRGLTDASRRTDDSTPGAQLSPRRIVIAYAGCSVIAWVLGVLGVTKLPSLPYVAVDVALEAAIIVGLWLLWRPAWVVAVALSVLGEVFVALHPVRGAVLLAIGAVQLVLLLLRPLRQALQSRPVMR